MPGWWNDAAPGWADVPAAVQVARLGWVAVLGFVIGLVYFVTQRRGRVDTAPFVATLALLTVLIAVVTQVVGTNLAMAFSLAGALSIIRFRTVVDDTRDTAFVIFAVVAGMAVGANAVPTALALVPVVAGAAVALRLWGHDWGGRAPHAHFAVRLQAGLDPAAVLPPVFARHLTTYRLVSVSTVKQGAALEVGYAARLRAGGSPLALIADLARVEGVQGVDWKDDDRRE